MITCHHLPDTNIAEVYVRGPLDAEDYGAITPTLRRVLTTYDSVNVLLVIDGVEGLTPAALWEDFKLSAEMMGSLDCIAAVSDEAWVDGLMKAAHPLFRGKLHHFEAGQREAALAWLRASVPA